jgi:hypothetical protein
MTGTARKDVGAVVVTGCVQGVMGGIGHERVDVGVDDPMGLVERPRDLAALYNPPFSLPDLREVSRLVGGTHRDERR